VSSESDPMVSSNGEKRHLSASSELKKKYDPIGYFVVFKNKRALFALF
jgi:hypothetical protein